MYGAGGAAKLPGGCYSDELAGLERGPLGLLLVEIRTTRGPINVMHGREPGGSDGLSNGPQNCGR